MKKTIGMILNIFAWILLALALLVTLAVFSSEKNSGIAKLFGLMPMSVQSDSMAPTYRFFWLKDKSPEMKFPLLFR